MPNQIKRPMLASPAKDLDAIKYPVLGSVKLDGIRALVINGQLMSREFKPIRNKWVQEQFSKLPEGTDGELICGDPTDKLVYRKTVKAVMAEEGEPTDVRFSVFDNFTYFGGFEKRFALLGVVVKKLNLPRVELVAHQIIQTKEGLVKFESECVADGYEGAMVRSLSGPYKQGRSSEREGYLLKIKRFMDAEAEIIGVEEGTHNANPAMTSPTGRTVHSAAKAGMVPTGKLGKVIVRGLNGIFKGVEFGIGTGFTDAERQSLWKENLIGRIVKYRCAEPQASGGYDKPRFPVYCGFRDSSDFSKE